nr:FHA domain-containing protein [Anaerolineae bacterium]
MDQPPDENQHDEDSGQALDTESFFAESPVDAEDTRPLKPLVSSREQVSSGEEYRPPATVLHEALPTRPLRMREPPSVLDETDRVRLVPSMEDLSPWRVIFQTGSPGKTRIGLNVWESLVMGRLDSEGKTVTHLDLSPHNARELGVSRQHALLVPTAEGLYISDLDSTNGTWVNGRYLRPGERHNLLTDDLIELGILSLRVRVLSPLKRQTGRK